jgi:glutaredoxin 3
MFCDKVKEFLSEKGVSYVERNVAEDQAALEELSVLGYMTTPVVNVDGHIVIGFDRARLEKLLQDAHETQS